MQVRTVSESDFSAIIRLNQIETPHVSSISADELIPLAAQSLYFIAAEEGGDILGFILTLGPGQEYKSLNYQWFSKRYDDFIYVDRIVVSQASKGKGIGRRLYQAVENLTEAALLACEVNLVPPNPDSLAFHHRLGFQEVGQQNTEQGKKRVCLMAKQLPPSQQLSSILPVL